MEVAQQQPQRKTRRPRAIRVKLPEPLVLEIEKAADRLPVSERWIRNLIAQDLFRIVCGRWQGKLGDLLSQTFSEIATPGKKEDDGGE